MRIRPADDADLLALARLFVAAASDLSERYSPEQLGQMSLDPESRLPMYRHLRATGAIFLAEEKEPVGFAAAVIRDGVWFLSQLWVIPERQGAGIGARLLDEALAWGRGSSTFSVISSPHPAAQRLYLRASMFPIWSQMEVRGSGSHRPPMPDGFADLGEGDQGWVDELDHEVRGVRRPEDHAFWRGLASGLALRRDGSPAGYVYVWPDGKIGPGAARDPRDMAAIIGAALHRAGGPATFSVPSTNWAALGELVRRRFSPAGASTFMSSRPLADASRYLSSGGALA